MNTPNGQAWAERKRYEQEQARQQQAQPPPRASGSGPRITKDLMRKLLMLCHPDKHSNSELSNIVTAELLKMRKELE
jgi:hypothetical protein